MITKLKYVGRGEGGSVTKDACYLALSFLWVNNELRATVIDDNGVPYLTQMPVDRTDEWQLEPVTECGEQIFPTPPPAEEGGENDDQDPPEGQQ
jgi:hypothetical protein